MFSLVRVWSVVSMLGMIAWITASSAAAQSPVVVGNGTAQSCTQQTLSDAVNTALKTAGSQIVFDCGESIVTIPVTKQFWIFQSLSLDGGKKIILDGGSKTRHFVVAHKDTKYGISAGEKWSLKAITLTLKNIALVNGAWGNVPQNERPNRWTPTSKTINKRDGGSLYVWRNGTLKLDWVVFKNNVVKWTKTLEKAPNDVTFAGWAIFAANGANISVDNTYFGKNYSTDQWWAIRADYKPTLTINNSVFEQNAIQGSVPNALGWWWALYYARATKPVAIKNSYFIANSSQRAGGAIKSHTSETIIDASYFIENKAGRGGAIYNLLAPLTIRNSFFMKNVSSRISEKDGAGWAIYVDGAREVDKAWSIKISTTTFDANTSHLGGWALSVCLYKNQSLTFTDNTLSNNTSQTYVGGGLYGECTWSYTISRTALFNNQVPSQSEKNKAARSDLFVRDPSKPWLGRKVSDSKKLSTYQSPTYDAPQIDWTLEGSASINNEESTTVTSPSTTVSDTTSSDTTSSTTDSLSPDHKQKIERILALIARQNKSTISAFITKFNALVTKSNMQQVPAAQYITKRLKEILASK